MKNQLMALALAVGGTFFGSSAVHAQIPIIVEGTPVFRAAYFRADGPQPFSTRSMRESQAARSQGIRGFSSRDQRSGTVYQSSRRLTFFSRRGKRFR